MALDPVRWKSLYSNKNLHPAQNPAMKKIRFIEDKVTLQPVVEQKAKKEQQVPVKSKLHDSVQRNGGNGVKFALIEPSSSVPRPISIQPSQQDIKKQIQSLIHETNEQKQILDHLELEEIHETVSQELDSWKSHMCDRITLMHDKIMAENDSSYDQLYCFQQTIQNILNDHLIRRLEKMARKSDDELNKQDLDEIELRLGQMKDEINLIKQLNLHLECEQVEIIGQLNLVKLTDFNLKKKANQERSSLPQATDSASPSLQLPQKNVSTNWNTIARNGINYVTEMNFRFLVKYQVVQKLEKINLDQLSSMIQLSPSSLSPGIFEYVLTIINQDDLEVCMEILSEVMPLILSSQTNELRILFHEIYIPYIIGKGGERSNYLKEKYQLNQIKIYSQSCPKSNERILSLSSQKDEYIICCLQEIYQNILEQYRQYSKEQIQSICLYNPQNYDRTMCSEYGGYEDDENKSTTAVALIPVVCNQKSNIQPNYDKIDIEDEKTWEMPSNGDSNQILVKYLTHLTDNQVGIIIGPFGQRITQIKEESGAWVHISDDGEEPSIIRGTKKQIAHALRLIDECLHRYKQKLPFQKHRSHGKTR
ncbi:unnamed protein product [Didymodactylos carnosus]|uniref:K Homology domain-containing protein n=1 Tax=Didymodactylos carnosus TaxID=1234261 RepID=A0A8S2CWA9_9BILA|nr:unnamed protein product [Didymodactylos carnosus]CAF3559429.1 unnamed protein product [Didymodactylos carnosus]